MAIDERGSLDWLVGLIVVPDRGGRGEDALQNAGDDTRWCASAVSFEVELSFEGLADRLEGLTA